MPWGRSRPAPAGVEGTDSPCSARSRSPGGALRDSRMIGHATPWPGSTRWRCSDRSHRLDDGSTAVAPTKFQLPSISTMSGSSSSPSSARRAARALRVGMPSSSHSSWLACPTDQATHQSATRSKAPRAAPRRAAWSPAPRRPDDPGAARRHRSSTGRHQDTAADLVQTDHDPVALVPELPFDRQRRTARRLPTPSQ